MYAQLRQFVLTLPLLSAFVGCTSPSDTESGAVMPSPSEEVRRVAQAGGSSNIGHCYPSFFITLYLQAREEEGFTLCGKHSVPTAINSETCSGGAHPPTIYTDPEIAPVSRDSTQYPFGATCWRLARTVSGVTHHTFGFVYTRNQLIGQYYGYNPSVTSHGEQYYSQWDTAPDPYASGLYRRDNWWEHASLIVRGSQSLGGLTDSYELMRARAHVSGQAASMLPWLCMPSYTVWDGYATDPYLFTSALRFVSCDSVWQNARLIDTATMNLNDQSYYNDFLTLSEYFTLLGISHNIEYNGPEIFSDMNYPPL